MGGEGWIHIQRSASTPVEKTRNEAQAYVQRPAFVPAVSHDLGGKMFYIMLHALQPVIPKPPPTNYVALDNNTTNNALAKKMRSEGWINI